MEKQRTIKEEAQASDGITKLRCIECGKKINDNRSLRCRNCYYDLFKEIKPLKGKVGINNFKWKGDEVSYNGLHKWVRRNKTKLYFCEHCGEEKKLQVANISGKYKRDVDDYLWLCKDCHIIFDNHN